MDWLAPYKFLVRGTLDYSKSIQAIATAMCSPSEVDGKTQLLKGLHFLDAGRRDTKLDLDWNPSLR